MYQGFTNSFSEICTTDALARPDGTEEERPDDRARKPYGAAASAGR